jgi:hypothetical protein
MYTKYLMKLGIMRFISVCTRRQHPTSDLQMWESGKMFMLFIELYGVFYHHVLKIASLPEQHQNFRFSAKCRCWKMDRSFVIWKFGFDEGICCRCERKKCPLEKVSGLFEFVPMINGFKALTPSRLWLPAGHFSQGDTNYFYTGVKSTTYFPPHIGEAAKSTRALILNWH